MRMVMVVLLVVLAGCAGDAGGASVAASEELAPRLVELTVASEALGREVPVRLLLPEGFADEPDRTWPVLYLLHGCCDDYRGWSEYTDVEELTAGTDLLVVMPDGGRAGFYSDWVEGPQWETFHLTELRALLEDEYRAGDQRAIVGLSMGGLGALGYAARNPDLFAYVGSFSGIASTQEDGGQLVQGILSGEGEDPAALWGDPQEQADVWAEHDPLALADRLEGLTVHLTIGDGTPGPVDAPETRDPTALQIESALRPGNLALRDRLAELDIPATVSDRPGSHAWPYWNADLSDALPAIQEALRTAGS
jgi:diacylglycerol O-acyltransferase / trehalose O-mycolyltransferase